MPHYIILVNWTDQGIRNVREVPQRAQAAKKATEAAGGKMTTYYTMGQYDLVALVEMPNDEAFSAAALAIGSLGNVRSTSLKAFTEEEFARIVSKMPPAPR